MATKNNLTKSISVVIEASSTGFGAYSDDLPGITGYGESVDDAKKDFISAFLETLEAYGSDAPKEFNNGDLKFNYKYDLKSIFNFFPMIDSTNFAKSIGMNSSLLRQYKGGLALSAKQKQKIEKGFHELGKELLAIQL